MSRLSTTENSRWIQAEWDWVNAIFEVFCEIGGVAPDARRGTTSYDRETNRESIKRL